MFCPYFRSERIEATQKLTELRCDMLRQQKRYLDKREKEKDIEEIVTEGVKKEVYKMSFYILSFLSTGGLACFGFGDNWRAKCYTKKH